ncbi:MAG: hypothetical protein AAB336_12000 [Acidobacteriota bacterium]
MAKSRLNSIIPVWIQNLLISIGLAIISSIVWDFLNNLGTSYSTESRQQMDINIYGLLKIMFFEIFVIWLIIFFSLSFLRSIYSTFAEAKNADTD